jgi:hypothetical protein
VVSQVAIMVAHVVLEVVQTHLTVTFAQIVL